MTHFYYSTGRTDNSIKNKLFISTSPISYRNQLYYYNRSDALILITEWKEFRNPDFDLLAEKLNHKIIFDGRNIYDKKIENKGFELYQIGC